MYVDDNPVTLEFSFTERIEELTSVRKKREEEDFTKLGGASLINTNRARIARNLENHYLSS